MKVPQKDQEKLIWDHMKNSASVRAINVLGSNPNPPLYPKLMFCLVIALSATCLLYALKLLSFPQHSCITTTTTTIHTTVVSRTNPPHHHLPYSSKPGPTKTSPKVVSGIGGSSNQPQHHPAVGNPKPDPRPGPTNLSHIVFGIGGSASLWERRKNYVKTWYKNSTMRAIVWLDNNNNGQIKTNSKSESESDYLPEIRISGNTSKFRYSHKKGHKSAIRISRIVSDTLRLGLKDVRWFVLGDDDTVFITENLVRVLNKYDHREYYYIGSNSESHLQNIYFSYAMAYGGGGFAISYPLAVALEKMQDRCIQRYPNLYGSDDRMHACMAELGVPLTKELGFHQYDVYGNLFGLLAAHPVTPFVSLHHLDVVEPIFPNMTQVQALQKLTIPMRLDSAGLMQQSVCYYKPMKWTISVSWGFAVQIIRGVISPREMEMPTRTFLNWYRRADYTAYAFNTRPVARNPCQKPFVYYLSRAGFDKKKNRTVSEYLRYRVEHPLCRWKMVEPSRIEKVIVYKKPDPQLWNRSPRRNCCRILKSRNKTLMIDIGVCRGGEVIEE